MDVEKIFRQSPLLEEITMDKILFESKYPVLFTCTNGQKVYLFSCCLVNASAIKYAPTKYIAIAKQFITMYIIGCIIANFF